MPARIAESLAQPPVIRPNSQVAGSRSIGAQVEDFASTLRGAKPAESPEAKARRTAEDFVAQALVFPVLKMMRESNQAAAPFAPGAYEKSIGALHDVETAVRIVRASNFPIVDAVARNLLRVGPAGVQARPEKNAAGGSDEHVRTPAEQTTRTLRA